MPDVINQTSFSFDEYIYEYIKNYSDNLCFMEPNYITIFNYFVTFLIAYLIYTDKSILIIILLVIFRSILDILDGAIARKCDKTSKLGANLDFFGDVLFGITMGIIFYIKSPNNQKIYFILTFIFGLFYALELSINFNILYKNKFFSLLHDNTLISIPLLILIGIYLIKK